MAKNQGAAKSIKIEGEAGMSSKEYLDHMATQSAKEIYNHLNCLQQDIEQLHRELFDLQDLNSKLIALYNKTNRKEENKAGARIAKGTERVPRYSKHQK